MTQIRFTTQVKCEDHDPSRVIPAIDGLIFEYEKDEDSDKEIELGHMRASLILVGRADDEGVDLFDAMDSISGSLLECFEELFDPQSSDFKESVADSYQQPGIMNSDVLFIEHLELLPAYRRKRIGAQVVQETIATFGSRCGLVVCKPFPLQYANWRARDDYHAALRKEPGFEENRVADFAKVAKFWSNLGFRKLPDSELYAYSTEYINTSDEP